MKIKYFTKKKISNEFCIYRFEVKNGSKRHVINMFCTEVLLQYLNLNLIYIKFHLTEYFLIFFFFLAFFGPQVFHRSARKFLHYNLSSASVITFCWSRFSSLVSRYLWVFPLSSCLQVSRRWFVSAICRATWTGHVHTISIIVFLLRLSLRSNQLFSLDRLHSRGLTIL